MQSQDREDFHKALLALGVVFRTKLDAAAFQGYWWALSEISLDDIVKACGAAAKTSKFMPSPAELRELSGGTTASRRNLDAWEAVRKAVRQHGYYGSVDFDDPAINATIRSFGGWIRISEMETEEFEKWFRRDFERVYAVYCAHPPTAGQGAPLVGWHEQQNTFNGYAIESHTVGKPHLIETGITPTPVIEDKRAVPKLELKKP